MVAWIRHIVLIGVSTTHIAEKINRSYGTPVSHYPSQEGGMEPGRWLEQCLLSCEESVIVSPPIGNPFTYHVLMNRNRTTSKIVHILTTDRDEERWNRISPFYHFLSDTDVWSCDDLYDLFVLKDDKGKG